MNPFLNRLQYLTNSICESPTAEAGRGLLFMENLCGAIHSRIES